MAEANSAPWEADPPVSAGAIPTSQEQAGPWESDPAIEPTFAEKAAAFGRQATGGLIESSAVLSGMGAGAAIGTLGGPASPVTVPLGAAGGAAAGYLFGKGAKQVLGIPSVQDEPEGVRPFAVAGEVIGAGAPIAATPMVAARAGAKLPASKVGDFINRIVEMAGRSPGTFAAAEGAGLAGAATGGAVAEAFDPGDPLTRFGGEVAGGFFNPTRVVVGASRFGLDVTKRVFQSMTQAGRETAAAKILSEILAESGEDPVLLARLLKESGIPGVTSAQKTGSEALTNLETFLIKENAKFGQEAKESAEAGLSIVKDALVALRGTGDPAGLTGAAQLQALRFRTLLATRVQSAEREATEAASRITADNPATRADLSKKAHESIETALRDARDAEKALWAEVPTDIPASSREIVSRMQELKAGMLPEERLPDIVEQFVARKMKEGGKTTSGELILFRSRALALAREADVQGKVNDARIYGDLADAALSDLNRMATEPSFGAYGRTAESYEAARIFSRELNDVFTRTFAGQAVETGRRGRAAIPPELMLRRALASGEEAGDLRFRELEEAMRFLPDKGMGGEQALETVLDAQERVLRLMAAETIDPVSGRANPKRLADILKKNGALFDRFPEAKANVQESLKSELRLREIEDTAKGLMRTAEQQAHFAKLANFENASDAVKNAVAPGSKAPMNDLTGMAKVAKRGGADAVEGLKAAIWEHAVRQSTSQTGEFSFVKLKAALFNPIRPGQPSLVQFMQKEGVMKAEDVARAEKLLGEAEKIENAVTAGTVGAVLEDAPFLFDTVVRSLGSKTAKALGGNTLIAQSAGSQYFRSIFEKFPRASAEKVLIEAAKNPKFMATLLEKPKSAQDGLRLARQIHAYLFQAGLTNLPEDQDAGP